MQRYVDEFAYRWNIRPGKQKEVFGNAVERVAANSPLPYKELIA